MVENKENLAQKLLQAAMVYEGKLQWLETSRKYVTFSLERDDVANDFMLLFCDRAGDIPSNIKQAVTEKYQRAKSISPKEYHWKDEDSELNMCCWEFCLLALADAGIISKEHIDSICFIVDISHANGNKDIISLDALYQHPLESYSMLSEKCLPNPGDILVFKSKTQSCPAHAGICIDENGNYLELSKKSVKKNSLIKHPALENGKNCVYFIPVNSINQNVQNFIEKYKNILSYTDSKKTESEMSKILESTSQYRTDTPILPKWQRPSEPLALLTDEEMKEIDEEIANREKKFREFRESRKHTKYRNTIFGSPCQPPDNTGPKPEDKSNINVNITKGADL